MQAYRWFWNPLKGIRNSKKAFGKTELLIWNGGTHTHTQTDTHTHVLSCTMRIAQLINFKFLSSSDKRERSVGMELASSCSAQQDSSVGTIKRDAPHIFAFIIGPGRGTVWWGSAHRHRWNPNPAPPVRTFQLSFYWTCLTCISLKYL